MRIGELAELTATPARSLRYYEQQGLIEPRREANGYRSYDAELVDRVIQIRGLLDSGIRTKVIARMLPCLDGTREIHPDEAGPELLAGLEQELDSLNDRIECLTRSRDAIRDYIAVVSASRANAEQRGRTG